EAPARPEAPAEAPSPTGTQADPPRPPAAPQGACQVSEARALLESAAPIDALAVAAAEGGGASVLLALGGDQLTRVELDAEGEPGPARPFGPFPYARALFAAERWGECLVAVGHGPCGPE